ncbi:MAG: DUF2125 domain-containing protein [Phenylobacterium sp.]|uniref:DUF2125 domain-containing protein n=1 Tax=Phenylobacterium sp. TaxID=1871053 RepID=UPI003918DEAA
MSVPDPAPARKHSRIGLYAPFAVALVVVLVWSGFWLLARQRTANGLEAAAQGLRDSGYEVSWKSSRIAGYPFRLFVVLEEPQVRDPSGWGLAAPRLEAESFLHGLGHWVMAAPQGLTVFRPSGGGVTLTGEVIRASLGKLDARPPSFSFEAAKVAFVPAPGAATFALAAAEKIELHLRAGPDDQGAVLLRVDGGRAAPGRLLGILADDKPVSLVWDSVLSGMSGFRGEDWAAAARAWSLSGGGVTVRQGGLSAGEAALNVQSGALTLGPDGRLRGALAVELRRAPAALSALARTGAIPPETAEAAAAVIAARQAGGSEARADLVFQAGRTTLGPVALGPAPRVY